MSVKNLGEILLEQGVIDREALDRALQIQSRRLGEILIEERLADPVAIAQALKFQAKSKTTRRAGRVTIETSTLDEILRRLESIEDQISAQRLQALPFLSSLISLRQSVEMMLLEPVETLFKKTRWIAQQSATEAGKTVEVICEGGGLIVDRSLIDELADVLLHLVRNAVDHGIEPTESRVAAGKPTIGCLRLGVSIFGGRLLVTLSDDGGGINDEAVYAKAVAQGLLSGERSEVSQQELYRLLFTPGFSTTDEVTALSGRGVGLDVVEAAAIRLGGEVTVHSHINEGATFRVSVPLHCARLTVVPLRIGSEWIAVNASEITNIELTHDSTALLSAASLFTEATPIKPPFLRVECLTGSRWAFDEVGQPEDVMVREASAFAKGSHGVIGGARMQNGRSMLVVDLGLLSGIASNAFC